MGEPSPRAGIPYLLGIFALLALIGFVLQLFIGGH